MAKKYGAKKDANHHAIVNVLAAMGVAFVDLSTFGCGIPDGLAFLNGHGYLIEIKNPGTRYGRRGLNVIQRKWLSQMKSLTVYILTSEDDAVAFCRGQFDKVISVTSDDAAASILLKDSA